VKLIVYLGEGNVKIELVVRLT